MKGTLLGSYRDVHPIRVDHGAAEGHSLECGTQEMTRRVVLLGLALQAAGLAGADEVFIRGGGRLTGEVVERGPDSILVDIGTGQIGLPLSSVDRIVPGETPVGLYRQRAASIEPDDVAGWLALGRWARDNDLETNAREAFESALAVDPTNASAHRALGRVQLDGRWMTREESYEARGYVRFEGAWVTSEERRALFQDRRARAEERRTLAEADARIREAEARARVAEAEAQRAEAALRRAESELDLNGGFVTGTGWTPLFAGSFYSPFAYSALGYPGYPHLGFRGRSTAFGPRGHTCRSGCGHRAPSMVRSSRRLAPHRTFRAATGAVRPAPPVVRHASRRSGN